LLFDELIPLQEQLEWSYHWILSIGNPNMSGVGSQSQRTPRLLTDLHDLQPLNEEMTMPQREPIFNLHLSRDVGHWNNPLGITQSFLPQQIVHLTFEREPDENGQDFFVKTTWYKDDIFYDEMSLFVENRSAGRGGFGIKYAAGRGMIGIKYDTPSKGKVDVYISYDEIFAHAQHIAQLSFTIEENLALPEREPIFNLRTVHDVDHEGKPLQKLSQTSFVPQSTVYLTYEKEPDESGQDLFVKTIWYKDDVIFDETVLRVESHTKYVCTGIKYETPSRGKVDVYICSDETGANERHIAQLPFMIEEMVLPDEEPIFNLQPARAVSREGKPLDITQFSQDCGETPLMISHHYYLLGLGTPSDQTLLFEPTQLFLPRQIVYLTFGKEPDESEQDLFVKTRWHKDDVMFDETILRVRCHAKYIYTGRKYDTPSRGKVDVSLCSDETGANERHLAQVPFTVIEEMPTPDRDLIFNLQTARAMSREEGPLEITQSFFPQQTVYLTYEKESGESGQDFFVRAIWYKDDVWYREGIGRTNNRHSRWGGIGTGYDTPSKGKVDVYVSYDETFTNQRHIAQVHFTIEGETNDYRTESGNS
jgi:hypothetical protein